LKGNWHVLRESTSAFLTEKIGVDLWPNVYLTWAKLRF